MDEFPQIPPVDPPAPESARAPGANVEISFAMDTIAEDGRRRFVRRVRWLLIAGIASFALASLIFVRISSLSRRNASETVQIALVRAEIEGLSRGNLQSAYGLLSERYRKEVPFEKYHALVIQHRRVFLTRQYRVTKRDELSGRTVIEAQLVTVNGQHYLAKFTLVQTAGRWWIDDLHWAAETDYHDLRA